MSLLRAATNSVVGRGMANASSLRTVLLASARTYASKVTPTDPAHPPTCDKLPPMYAPNYDLKYDGEIPENEDINPDRWGPDEDRSVNPHYAAGILGLAGLGLYITYEMADFTANFVHISPAAARELDEGAIEYAYTHLTSENPAKKL